MLVLDIGGSFIKYGLADEQGNLLEETAGQIPSDANGEYEHFLQVLRKVIALGREKENFQKASVSIPGPFDYFTGTSQMRHKFTALYGKTISTPFEEAGIEVHYLHDSTAFLLGEAAPEDGSSPCGIMLGTGLGFAMMREGRICVNAAQTPALTLWNMPWKDGIAEDYVSQKTLLSLYGGAESVRAIADAARGGDEKAIRTFHEVGKNLSDILCFILPRLGCDSLVLGGQISKSADLFDLRIPIPWRICQHPEETALRGAGRYVALGRERCVQEMESIHLL